MQYYRRKKKRRSYYYYTTIGLIFVMIGMVFIGVVSHAATYYSIDDQGYVGIGTTVPTHELNVVGDINVTGNIIATTLTGPAMTADTNATTECSDEEVLMGEDAGLCMNLNQTIQHLSSNVADTNATTECGNDEVLMGDGGCMNLNQTIGHIDTNTTAGDSPFTNDTVMTFLANKYPMDVNISSLLYVNGTSGNVGIGTTSPSELLHIIDEDDSAKIRIEANTANKDVSLQFDSDSGFFNLGIDDSDSSKLKISNATSLATGTLLTMTSTGNVGIGNTDPVTMLAINQSSDSNGIILFGFDNRVKESGEFRIDSGGNLELVVTSGNEIQFRETNDINMVIDSSGNVGIGTTSPTHKLSLIGQMNITRATEDGRIIITRNDGATYIGPEDSFDFWTYENIPIRIANNGAERVRIDTSGNVGIGTTSPATLLEVAGTGNIDMNVSNMLYVNGTHVGVGVSDPSSTLEIFSTGTSLVRLGGNGGAALELRDDDDNVLIGHLFTEGNPWDFTIRSEQTGSSLVLGSNGESDKMVIDSSGNIGIGTTTPTHNLTIIGDINLSAGKIVFSGDSLAFAGPQIGTFGDVLILNTGASGLKISNQANNVDLITILNGGAVGINTTTPTHTLDVVGDVNVTGWVNATQDVCVEGGNCLSLMTSGGKNNQGDTFINNSLHAWTAPQLESVNVTSLLYVNATLGRVGVNAGNPSDEVEVAVAGTSGINDYGGLTVSNIADVSEGVTIGWDDTNNRGYIYARDAGSGGSDIMIGNQKVFIKNSNGNVGIGTTSPAAKLEVAQTSDATHELNVSDLLYVNATLGNIGIGDATPSFKLDVNSGAGNSIARFISSDDTAQLQLQDDDTIGYMTTKDSYLSIGGNTGLAAGNLNIGTSSGNVGIGTASPAYKLDIFGGAIRLNSTGGAWLMLDRSSTGKPGVIRFDTLGSADWHVGSPDSGDYDGDGTDFYIGTAEDTPLFLIDTSGQVGIGTTAPTHELNVINNVNITGNLTMGAEQGDDGLFWFNGTGFCFGATACS